MVKIEKSSLPKGSWQTKIPVIAVAAAIGFFLLWRFFLADDPSSAAVLSLREAPSTGNSDNVSSQKRPLLKKSVILDQDNMKSPLSDITNNNNAMAQKINQCPVMKISDLSPEEQHPKADHRYQVTPPEGGLMHLLCCQTTKGPFNALVHEAWAPRGAKRVLDMVQSGYFNSKDGVPMMRCLKNFICQFGLNSDPKLSNVFRETFPDDKNWLPEGPKHRKNDDGVIRFARGYLAYAGGGPNTRDNQFIVSLVDVEALAGGSPWEVPWGELVGKHSFDTLGKWYTGYGEDGPQQGDLWKKGVTKETRKKFPKLDYITGCSIVDQAIQV